MRFLSVISVLLLLRCGLTSNIVPPMNGPVTPASKPGQLVWDQKTLRKVSSGSDVRYSGYARLIQLHDQSLLTVYEASGSIVAVKVPIQEIAGRHRYA